MVCEGSEWSNKIIAPLFGEIAAKLLIVSLNGQKHPEHFSYWEKIFSLDSDPLLIDGDEGKNCRVQIKTPLHDCSN